MKTWFFFLLVLLGFQLTSCIEIIDDLSVNPNGSGTYKYTVNLSSSKVKLNSYLALDSLDGKRVPSLDEIKERVNGVVQSLRKREGITNVEFESNYTDYIFKLSLDFASIAQLQEAIKDVVRDESKDKDIEELDKNWIQFGENRFSRSIPKISIDKANRLTPEEIDLLRQGTYTCITRFQNDIARCDNKAAVISKNKKAVMIRTDAYTLSQQKSTVDHSIYLVD